MRGVGISDAGMSHLRNLRGNSFGTQYHQYRLYRHPMLPGQASAVPGHVARNVMVVARLEFRVENDRGARASPHHRNIVRKHHRRRGLRTKRLDIGFYPSGYEAEQTEEKRRSFVRKGLQNPVKGFVDAGVPEVHTSLVGIRGGYSHEKRKN